MRYKQYIYAVIGFMAVVLWACATNFMPDPEGNFRYQLPCGEEREAAILRRIREVAMWR
ncbi:MAG: hypothetical protein J6T71_01670 [Paludibacteraceae bacterium]|nr:hypothetical protein [Paludibacteraceae bacterium]